LEGLASVLEADLATFRSKILRILTDCAIKMPEKCTIYTTLVGLLNAKNYNFGGEVSNKLYFRMSYEQDHIEKACVMCSM
jgi:hypothetical protein